MTAPDVPLHTSQLRSLPLLSRGKVRDNYAAGEQRILMLASDRISAFDVVMGEPIPGKGRLQLTGTLGDVMKESARIALTQLRVHAGALKIDPERIAKTDVHIHVPEGAVPKEGPSAGVALFLSLASAFTGRPVPGLFAFTGEINLSGEVLAIGGLLEKSLAALDAGATDLWVPAQNEAEIAELPPQVRNKMKIHRLKTVEEALKALD